MQNPGDILEKNNSIYMLISNYNSFRKRTYLRVDLVKKHIQFFVWWQDDWTDTKLSRSFRRFVWLNHYLNISLQWLWYMSLYRYTINITQDNQNMTYNNIHPGDLDMDQFYIRLLISRPRTWKSSYYLTLNIRSGKMFIMSW